MEFTDAYKQTGPCCFSPNARYVAAAADYRLVVRDTLSFKVLQLCQIAICFPILLTIVQMFKLFEIFDENEME